MLKSKKTASKRGRKPKAKNDAQTKKETPHEPATDEKEGSISEEQPLFPTDDDYLPFPMDDDDRGCGAITGGEGITDCSQMKMYRTARELMEADDLTDAEKVRLERIKQIPDEVREIVEEEIGTLTKQIMELENRHDRLVDYLNGEETRCRK